MGMDLVNHRDEDCIAEEEVCLHYNWTGWRWLQQRLREWGVSTEHFSQYNDVGHIPADKCVEVANSIQAHLTELNDNDRAWIEPHIDCWRKSGGFFQY